MHTAESRIPRLVLRKPSVLTLGAIGLAVIAVSIVCAMTSLYGAGTSPDSANYVFAARNLLAGHGFQQYDGSPYVQWPPAFPLALTLLGTTGLDPLVAARHLNALLSGLTVFLAGLWLRQVVAWRPLVLLGMTTVLLSAPLLRTFSFAWSEPLFMVNTLGHLLAITKFREAGRLGYLLAAALMAALACLTRYAGTALVLASAVLLLRRSGIPARQSLMQVAVFLLIALTPLAIWLGRNMVVAMTLTGPRPPSATGFTSNLATLINNASIWILPSLVPAAVRIPAVVGALAVLAGTAAIAHPRLVVPQPDTARVGLYGTTPLIAFLVAYTVWIVAAASIVALDPLGDRLLAPLCLFTVLLLFLLGDRFLTRVPHASGCASTRTTVLVVLIAWLLYPGLRSLKAVGEAVTSGPGGYATATWMGSEVIARVRDGMAPGKIITNRPAALYLLAGIPAILSPRRHAYQAPGTPTDDLAQLRAVAAEEGKLYLVWMSQGERSFLYDLAELLDALPLEPVIECPDGSIYQLR